MPAIQAIDRVGRAWLRASHETQKLRFEAALETISERLKRAVPSGFGWRSGGMEGEGGVTW